jgi:hypothetical protein
MLPALATTLSSVLSASGGAGGGGAAATPDTITIDTGPVNQTAGGGPLIGGANEPWLLIGLAALAVVALVKWR